MPISRKGIILAGGIGSRLWPLTVVSSKQLLPVYDKPMIYYALTTLMLAGIQSILIVTGPNERERFETLLGDGQNWGIDIRYAVQPRPRGIPEALLIGEQFLDGHRCALILGDNIFYGAGFADLMQRTACGAGPIVFCHWVNDPGRYGVLEFDTENIPIRIEEKPMKPKSNWAVTGLYFYDPDVLALARELKPSRRGELEITDINSAYLESRRLKVETLGRGFAWFDAGTPNSLLQASVFVQTIEERQGLKIGCPEEVAYRMGFIDASAFDRLIGPIENSEYGMYLRRMLQ
jgi:glucose-1-phosphate thymidylyltransferase